MTLEKSQRQQRASPVTRHFPALGHRALTHNYRWINWWQLGQVLLSCTLRSAAEDHLLAGEGSARGFWAAPFAALCSDVRWHPWQFTGTCWVVDWDSWGAAGCLTGMCPQGRKPPRSTASSNIALGTPPLIICSWNRSLHLAQMENKIKKKTIFFLNISPYTAHTCILKDKKTLSYSL